MNDGWRRRRVRRDLEHIDRGITALVMPRQRRAGVPRGAAQDRRRNGFSERGRASDRDRDTAEAEARAAPVFESRHVDIRVVLARALWDRVGDSDASSPTAE